LITSASGSERWKSSPPNTSTFTLIRGYTVGISPPITAPEL
jgi:hypothetical protein